jgi:hypothetical protein
MKGDSEKMAAEDSFAKTRLDPFGATLVEDYERLYQEFGIQPFNPLLSEIPNPSAAMRRGVIFGHRDFERVLSTMKSHGEFAVMSEPFNLLGRPANLAGYITQGGSFGLHNTYDTENGLNSALMNLFVEGEYSPVDKLRFYSSGMLSVDWAYQLNSGRDSWHDKLFSESKGHLNVDSNYWQILNEAHFTWTPGNFFFRVGKQIVSWGEMDLLGRDGFLPDHGPDQPDGRPPRVLTVIPIWPAATGPYIRNRIGAKRDVVK